MRSGNATGYIRWTLAKRGEKGDAKGGYQGEKGERGRKSAAKIQAREAIPRRVGKEACLQIRSFPNEKESGGEDIKKKSRLSRQKSTSYCRQDAAG